MGGGCKDSERWCRVAVGAGYRWWVAVGQREGYGGWLLGLGNMLEGGC